MSAFSAAIAQQIKDPTHQEQQRQRQSQALNQPPKRMKRKSNGKLSLDQQRTPLQAAFQRVSPYNQAVPNAPGLVSAPGRRGVVTSPTSAPGINAETDARIAAEQARKQAVAQRVAANFAQQQNGETGSLKQAMFGDKNKTNFTGSVGYREDGSRGWMSDAMRARQNMSEEQRELNDAFMQRRANRKSEAASLRSARAEQRRQAAQHQQPNIMHSPLFAAIAQRNPEAAAQLALQAQNSNQQSLFQQAALNQQSQSEAAERALRERELDSTLSMNGLKTKLLESELDPDRMQRDDLMAMLSSPVVAEDPRMKSLLTQQMMGLVGGDDAAELAQTPMSLAGPLLNEAGGVNQSQLYERAMHEFLDSGKDPNESLQSLVQSGVSPEQLRQFASDNTPGFFGELGENASLLWSKVLGAGDDKEAEQLRRRKAIGAMRKALGMKVPAGYASGRGAKPTSELMEMAFGSP